MSYIPEPVTRIDKYLAYIAGNMDVALPDHPITRKEHYLAAWAEKSGFEDVDVAGEPPLTLENAIGKPLKGLRIYGKSKQVTTTGAQLLEKNIVVHPPNGKVSTIVLFEGELSGTYTVSCELEGEVQYPARAALEIIVDGVDKFCLVNNHTVVTGMITKITCFAQNTYCDFTGTLNIMLNAGSTPLPWEPYTGCKPSPSPDYPQEVESVGMRWSTGANLSDAINVTSSTNETWLVQQNGYSITTQGTYTENDPHAYKNVRIELDPAIVAGKKITASVEYAENNAGEALRTICDINYKRQSKIYWNKFGVNNPITITIPEDVASVNCRIHIIEDNEKNVEHGTYTTTVKGLMISIGDKVLPWEPYTGGIPKPYGDKIGVGVRGKNLLPTTMYRDSGTINGVKFTNNGDGSITAVGTATDVTYFTLYGYNTLGDRGTLPSMEPGDALYISDCLLQQTNSQSIISIDENKSTSFYKSTTTMYAAIRISKGKNVNKTFFPMISKGSKPIPYEPYHEPQFASIAIPNGLPGIPVSSGGNYTDANGQQWICDEIDFGRGVYVQRVAYTTVDGDKIIFKETGNYWNLPRYSSPGCIYAYNHKTNFFPSNVFRSNNNHSFIFTTPEWMKEYFDTVDELNEFCKIQYDAGTPLTLYYALVTPVETPLTSDQLAAYKQLHTYKGTTIIDNDAGAYMSVKYEKMK